MSKFLKKYRYHILFWILAYVIEIALNDHNPLNSQTLISELVNILFFMFIVYLNINYLFPHFLKEKGILPHVISLIVTSALVSPIKTLTLYLINFGNPGMQSMFIENQKIIFLTTFFVGISTTVYCVMDDWIRVQREKKKLQSETMQTELKFLRSQINPHFLFNTLNSLYAHTLRKSDEAPNIVLRMSEMMRYMLYESNEKTVFLTQEINYLENYLELERLRLSDNMKITFEINGDAGKLKIAPLIFIPFVENAFKHGPNSSLQDGFIDIKIEIDATNLHLKVTNNKGHRTKKDIEGKRSGGIGLNNVKRRLELLYPNRYNLNISDTNNEYGIELNIELNNDKKLNYND